MDFKASKTKWNFHPFFPGLVGGHCISVDPYYLAYKSELLGYKPKVTSPAITSLAVYQLVPRIGSGDTIRPDSKYYLRIKEGMVVESEDGIQFRTTELLDFADADEREISVYERDATTNNPKFYLVKKPVDVISATEKQLKD